MCLLFSWRTFNCKFADFSSSEGLIVRTWFCCVCKPASFDDDVWLSFEVPSDELEGMGRVVTMWVTDLEKNFSSRCTWHVRQHTPHVLRTGL